MNDVHAAGAPLADETGTYPALAGCVPAALGRRAAARALDSVLILAVYLVPAAVISTPTQPGGLALVPAGGSTAVAALLFAELLVLAAGIFMYAYLGFTGYLPGGRLLGVRQVRVQTGGSPGWAGLGKYLLVSLATTATCGIGYLVTVVLIKPPLNRGWHDRATGLIVLDVRAGRNPGVTPPPPPATPSAPPAAAPRGIVPVGQVLQPPVPTTPAGMVPEPASGGSGGGSGRPPAGSEGGAAGVDEFLGSVPWGSGGAGSGTYLGPSSALPVSPGPTIPQVNPLRADPYPADALDDDPGYADASLGSQTVVSPGLFRAEAVPVVVATLIADDGLRVVVDEAVLLGRDPAPRPGLGPARLCPVVDPSMSMSKTHAVVGPHPDGVWLTDLNSTNGSGVTSSAGTWTAAEPGMQVAAEYGATVHLGDRTFRVVEA